MRIFISSTFTDLRDHRAAAIRVLRQMGHEVIAMEDMVAGTAPPLAKVREMVDRSEAYVGIFAWRYGDIPKTAGPPAPAAAADPDGIDGETSITHYEYKRALQRQLPVMAFLLDEQCPWPPHLIDGFEKTQGPEPSKIRDLRKALQQERVVSRFTTPQDLEARVSAAVTMVGLTRQLDLQPATAFGPEAGVPNDSSTHIGIANAITAAGDHQRVLKIDLAGTWWSTRLYLMAALAERLTNARRILVVDSRPAPVRAGASRPTAGEKLGERLVGMLSTATILSALQPKAPALGKFALWLHARPKDYNELEPELREILTGWHDSFGDKPPVHGKEKAAKVNLTAEILRRWFGEAMLLDPVPIADLQRASVVDLLRVLDYPGDYVPVLTKAPATAPGEPAISQVEALDKAALKARLARSYLEELMDRARIA